MLRNTAGSSPESPLESITIPIQSALNNASPTASVSESGLDNQLLETVLPDPWETTSAEPIESARAFWQFPLDPGHEIGAAPAPDGILIAEEITTSLRIPAYTSEPSLTPIQILLQEEIKINAAKAPTLWNRIRDGLALLWCNP